MLEIFLIMIGILIPLGAAKRRRSMRRRRYLKANVDENLLLGTLNTKVLISDTWDGTVTERALISSIVCTWSLDGIVAGQGPIVFGVAHSDYSDAEIEAVIEASGSWDEGDLVSQEILRRKVRMIGQFVSELDTGTDDIQFNDGKPVKTKLNWILTTGDTLKMWAYNVSSANLSTADPAMRATGHANLWPQ